MKEGVRHSSLDSDKLCKADLSCIYLKKIDLNELRLVEL